MGDHTSISWTDATWAPARGCSRISEGCRNCYAERIAARFSGPGQAFHGYAQVIAPRDHLDAVGGRRDGWTRKVEFQPDQLKVPLGWRKPRRIFVSSMTDIFHESLTNEQIAAVFGVMAATPRHTYQLLTKRARRMREWFSWISLFGEWRALRRCGDAAENHGAPIYVKRKRDGRSLWNDARAVWPLPNVWLGTSVENQAAAEERIPELLATPAAIRFLSCEPLIGEVTLTRHLARMHRRMGAFGEEVVRLPEQLHWIIAGCESGPGARPCDVAWLRSLRDQCAAAGVAFFLKQARELIHDDDDPREYAGTPPPRVASPVVCGAGSRRKAGGVIELPYLDGKQHAAFPEVPT